MLIALNIFLVLCMFTIGSLFGSFFSLATYRIPRREDITHSRSYCPKCKHRLEFFDLIPVLSYIFHGGKCKYCGDKISLRYFLLETGNGILFVILYLIFGYTLKLAAVAICYAVIFVLIGASIMKSKMTQDEIDKVNMKIKNKKLSKKAGVFISELVIAIVLFIATFLTIVILNRNTRNKVNDMIAKANANNLLIKNIEICLASNYENLVDFTLSETIDNIVYNVNTDIVSLFGNDETKEDIVKQIEVTVSYNLNGEYFETNMKTLKGKI